MVLADAPGWLLAYCLNVFVVTTGKIGPSQHSREVVKEGNHTKVPNLTKSYGSFKPSSNTIDSTAGSCLKAVSGANVLPLRP